MHEPEAFAYLESLIPHDAGAPAGPFDLSTITRLLDGLGNPHADRAFIHVGGTSGKGSTATLLAGILTAAGYRTGLHVSPHMVALGERAQVDGAPADGETIARHLTRIRDVADARGLRPSYFEALWAVALLRFAQAATDVNVVEVGLGGRLDATNVIPSRHQILTNVGLDHTAVLGRTKAAILREKQEIVKPGSQVVSGLRDARLRAELERFAEARDARVAFAGRDFQARRVGAKGLDFRDGALRLMLSTRGIGQVENAALAVAMACRAADAWPRIDEPAIREGLAATRLPGRLDVVGRDPLTIFDGAHNPEKARWLVRTLASAFPGQRFVTVFRFKPRPDVWTTLEILAAHSEHVILTQSRTAGDMGVEPGFDAAAARRAQQEHGASSADSPQDALALAGRLATANGWGVLVTGSIYMLQELYARR